MVDEGKLMDSKVLIGVVTGEYARRADFYDYYNLLEKPPGTVVLFCHERSPAKGRNIIIDAAIEHNCTHILFIDDDMACKPEALKQLLEHDLDIVTGLYLQRAAPFRPFMFDLVDDDGRALYSHFDGTEERLKKVANAAFGFCLIKTTVFEKLEKPYVRLGELNPVEWCDDIGFFNRVTKAGFDIYCDTECRLGHIGTMVVWPQRDNKTWYVGIDTSGKVDFSIPYQVPELV